MNKEYVESAVTGKRYAIQDIVRIVNQKQVALYLNNNVELLDVYPSVDSDNKFLLVFIFDKAGSHEAYDLWCKRELTWKD